MRIFYVAMIKLNLYTFALDSNTPITISVFGLENIFCEFHAVSL